MSESAAQHREKARRHGPVRVAIVTVSDTRTAATDANQEYLTTQLTAEGHEVTAYHLITDEPAEVERVLEELCSGPAQALLFNGGTGIAPRDTTFDVLNRRLEKVLPGFGELFRMLSYDQVGPASMLSRAVGGVYRGRIIFSVPGSPAAVRLAWEKLVAPELSHLVWELSR